MFTDTLNTALFSETNGKNFRTPKKLDATSVLYFFNQLGYTVIFQTQAYRHVHGKLQRDGETYFFKLASTADIGERTLNEKVWNESVGSLFQAQYENIIIPKIIDFGYFDNLFYYIAEYFEGQFLATKNPSSRSILKDHLDQVVDFNVFLLNFTARFYLPRDESEYVGGINYYDICTAQDRKLLSEIREFGLDEVFEIEARAIRKYRASLNHGDFVPWHFIVRGRSLVLIDAEQASFKLPRYYDVVYFFTRIYTGVQAPDLAKRYLKMIFLHLSDRDRDLFIEEIRPLVANRLIGGFWHSKNENMGVKYQQQLKSDLLNYQLITV